MFEKSEIDAELHSRLKAAGLNPLDPIVRTIISIVSVNYAEQTSKVLKRVMDVIDGLTPETTKFLG
jgi:hypothetical protein